MNKDNPFRVPENYFEQASAEIWSRIDQEQDTFFAQQKAEILKNTVQKTKMVFIRKIVVLTSSAAAILAAGVFFFSNSPAPLEPTFSELITTVELDESTILLDATEEQFIEYVGEDLALLGAERKMKETENKISKEIKPKDKSESPNFEAVEEEEIIEYLLQENYLEIELY